MERAMVGFHRDPEGHWVTELECGHDQHLYHRPPFQVRPWVLTPEGRADRRGRALDCPLCDRAELPDRLQATGRSPEWDTQSPPQGLCRAHRLAPGTWGRLVVEKGRLSFHARTVPPIDRLLQAGAVQPLPPGVEHRVEPGEPGRFFIEFFGVVPGPSRDPAWREEPELGGEPACWAHVLCPSCGRPTGDGHNEGCPIAGFA